MRSHWQLTNELGWACVFFNHEKVKQLRRQEAYFEFFESEHIRNRYAIFSVTHGYDFLFEDAAGATEFALRFT
jgi:hypothetical protein